MEDSDLSRQQFQAFFQEQQNPDAQSTSEATEEQKQSFEQARNQIVEIEQAVQLKKKEAIETGGLSLERFNQILAAAQSNPDLQEQIKLLLES